MPFVALALSLAFGAEVATTPGAAAALLVVVPLAFWTKLLVDAIVACSAMWLVRIDGIRSIYAMVMLLLGGQFAPLSAMPDAVATIARLLPFYWTVGFPTELAIGRVDPSQALFGAAVLAGWSILLYLVLQPVWRAGTRAYEAVGQ
jgi:ABC-2 type transport system permease protein